MKRVFIIHGWGGYPTEGCFPQLKKDLEEKGFSVITPAMPEPLIPKIDVWISYLNKQIGVADSNTILVGHSIGSQTILRYLQTLPKNVKIGGCVFLAPWVNLTDAAYETKEDKNIAKPWLETPINWDEIKLHCKKFTAVFSDDDPLVPLSDSEIFKKKLGAKIIVEKGKKHFSGSDGIKELPSLFESILEIAK